MKELKRRIFVNASILTGALMSLYFIHEQFDAEHSFLGIFVGLLQGLTVGLLVGWMMSVLLSLMHAKSVQRLIGKEPGGEALSVVQIRQQVFDEPPGRVYDECAKTLKHSSGVWTIKNQDRKSGILLGTARPNWLTMGSIIQIRVSAMDARRTELQITIKPLIPWMFVDYGANLRRIEEFVHSICQRLHLSPS